MADGKKAEIVVMKGREYLLIDGYIALRIDMLRELFTRPFNRWWRDAKAKVRAPGSPQRR